MAFVMSSMLLAVVGMVGGAAPNLMWIMADDLGVGELGSFGSQNLSTPNIDALAESGLAFTSAYAGYTVCAPSRATLFTGRHSGRLAGAPSNWPTLPTLLRQAGYETAAFGKSAPMDATESPSTLEWGLPLEHGFETFAGQASQLFCHNMYPASITVANLTVPLPLNRKAKSRELCMGDPDAYNYTTDVFTDAALEWLRARPSAAARPFFLYVAYTVPHAGGWDSAPKAAEEGAPVPSELSYAAKAWPVVERDHAASVSYLDMRVGDLLRALDAQRLASSTVVFFASDNGAHNEGGHDVRFFGSTAGLRGFKRSYYEGGVRSPSIVRWPGVTPAGGTSDHPWAFWDVLPTMLELAGVPLPPGSFDGRSIVPTLRGQRQPAPPYLYWTWRGMVADDLANEPRGVASGARSGYAARVGEWKAVVHNCANGASPSDADAMELYNLTADAFERSDVSAQHPRVTARIKALLASEGLSCQCFQCSVVDYEWVGDEWPGWAKMLVGGAIAAALLTCLECGTRKCGGRQLQGEHMELQAAPQATTATRTGSPAAAAPGPAKGVRRTERL